VKSGYSALSSAGKSYVTFSGTKKLNVAYRVRSTYVNGTSGDRANLTTYFYFTE
jgi:hypothetical protein